MKYYLKLRKGKEIIFSYSILPLNHLYHLSYLPAFLTVSINLHLEKTPQTSNPISTKFYQV